MKHAVATICVALVLWVGAAALPATAATDAYAPVLPSVRDDVIARTQGEVSSYALDLELDPDAGTLSGTQRVEFVNHTGTTQTEIPFRLYPNAGYYGEGALAIDGVRVDGERVNPAYTEEETVMTVPLAAPLPPGAQASIAMRYTVTVPVDSSGTFGVFSRDAERGTWILADWYPVLAGWENGTGWRVDPLTPLGDPTFTDIALYDVALSMPSGWSVAATGTETPSGQPDGRTRWQITTGPARELSLVIDDDFETSSRTVAGTEITVYTDGGGAASEGAKIALDAAAEALPVYSDAFRAYPYEELDLVETELDGALGVSWTGLVFLNGAALLANPFYVSEEPGRLHFTVAHEVGHQWWGAIVGMNSNDHTFLLEGLTNYLSVVAVERTEGNDAAHEQLVVQCAQPYLRALEQSGDGIADLPVSVETEGPSRSALYYGKAALGFLAIRQQIGDEAFFAALSAWADEFAFRIAEPDDLLDAFEIASGRQLGDLWQFWFQAAETTAQDVQALLAGD